MRSRLAIWILTATLLLSTTAALAGQQQDPRVVVTHEVPEDGRTYVGNVNHFGFVIFGDDGSPDPHNDAVVEIELNGERLYKTEPSSGHDYDGVDLTQVVFPEPGTYEVHVTVPREDGDLTDTFTGTVHEAPTETVRLDVDAPEQATAGEPAALTYKVLDADGEIVEHSDVLVQIRDAEAEREQTRVHTHTHDEPQSFSYVFPEAGTYEVRLTAYQAFPNPNATFFEPITVTRTIEVDQAASPPAAGPPTTRPLENRVDTAGDGPYELHATYDPYTSIGPHGRIHLNTVVTDAQTGELVPHVDFDARLLDPRGTVLFESETLHEYDGVFEFVTEGREPGDYTLEVTAERGEWTATSTHTFSVHPPVVPLGAGPVFTTVDGLDGAIAGEPTPVTVHLRNAAGQPYMHSEVQLTVREKATGLPVLDHKLHTHDSGDFPAEITFPSEGTYEVQADGTGLEPSPTPAFYGPSMGEEPRFEVDVAPAEQIADPDEALEANSEETNDTPSIGALTLTLVAAMLAAVQRRW